MLQMLILHVLLVSPKHAARGKKKNERGRMKVHPISRSKILGPQGHYRKERLCLEV